jgi:protein TonB
VVTLHIVIDKTGSVARIRLEKAIGHGLDEKAMECVENWRFDPATKDGQPIAMGMNIELSFNLY